ncbi:MAG: membrane dipeptidase [Microbacterium sp.]
MSGYFWDQHACPDISTTASLDALGRYETPSAVSLNVGYAPHSGAQSRAAIAHHKTVLARRDDAAFTGTLAEVDAALAAGKAAVWFDLEDTAPLDGRTDAVAEFYALGVRTMLTTYNAGNAAGSGCMDAVDEGLTAYGMQIVREMNAVGMVVDAAHVSARSMADMLDISEAPVIVSHTAARSLHDARRCITDAQARAIGGSGGVIGVCGIGIFLGENEGTVNAMVRHIEHFADTVGVAHVGIGSDFSFDIDEVTREIRESPELFPEEITRYGEIRMVPPEQVTTIPGALRARGWSDDDIDAVCFANFRRIAAHVWR